VKQQQKNEDHSVKWLTCKHKWCNRNHANAFCHMGHYGVSTAKTFGKLNVLKLLLEHSGNI
jgi:hypothetical protein